MEFALTDEHTAMVDTARQFAGDRLAPGYAAREKTGEVEPEVWREMGQLGLIATELPEDVGGIGCDTVTAGLLQEAMSTGDVNVALLALLASLNGQIVYHNALPEVAAHWLPPLIGGEIMLALALTEPGSGSDAAQLRLQAVRDGADFILNGEKTSISAADQAHAAVVFARTDPDAGARGISA
ncbi:MAG: acyl-CoA dehydrogenase family protein, partial [Pseudomonadota bacterium]|nr:acyl-CoA dehydrogenase family protein [Pseudomonadota bacterium]